MSGRNDTIYITLDMDWACDDILKFVIDLLEKHDIQATFFVTHNTPLLRRIRENPDIELGAHPNFNFLLNNESPDSAEQIIRNIKEIVPESVSIRSHALACGSLLSSLFIKAGFSRESNIYYHVKNGTIPQPYYDVSGILRIIHFWEDDCQCLAMEKGMERDWSAGRFLDYCGIKVYDFHPIHLFLNTCDMNVYNRAKIYSKQPDILSNYINPYTNSGALHFFNETIETAKKRGLKFGMIKNMNI